jgi:hypothetical protein
MRKMRRRALVDCLVAVILAGTPAAFAAGKEPPPLPISRDKVRLILLDNCVFDEWKTREVKDKIADQCKCAAAKIAHQLSDADVKTFKDRLPKSAMGEWQAAMKYCVNPPRPRPAAASARTDEPSKTGAVAGAAPPAAAPATPAAAADNPSGGGPPAQ